MERTSVTDGPFTFEVVSIPRPEWFTNLDFLCTTLRIDEAQVDGAVVSQVRCHVQGFLKVHKNTFGHKPDGTIGYHLVTTKWIFFSKYVDRPIQNGIYHNAFRLNSHMPITACPLMHPDHTNMPPSVIGPEAIDIAEPSKPGYAVVYEVLVEISMSDETERVLSLPLKFCPTIQDTSGQDSKPNCQEMANLTKSLVFKDLLRTKGQLQTTVSFPQTLYLSRCATILRQEILITLTWSGDAMTRPELHSLVPYLMVSGSYETAHPASDKTASPHVNQEQLKGREHSSPHWRESAWTDISAGLSRKEIKCVISILSKTVICPSFTCCLASRSHQLRLVLGFKSPGSRLFKHQTLQMQFPITVQMAVPNMVDPDEEFMKKWISQETESVDLQGMTVTEFFKQPDRRPHYLEMPHSCAQPAPMPSAPPYSDPSLQSEINRPPAWQGKRDSNGG